MGKEFIMDGSRIQNRGSKDTPGNFSEYNTDLMKNGFFNVVNEGEGITYRGTPALKDEKDPKIATEKLDEVIVTANSPETIESNIESNEKNALFRGDASEKKIAQGANTPKALKKEVSDQDYRIHNNRRGGRN